jgi:glyoxylase-like metal-dependent hydrolase (beta-lactamase superfamily II)/ferredoxin
MAQAALRDPRNAEGDWFVDSSCIDCAACRQLAPGTFDDAGSQSIVVRQPVTEAELLAAGKALVTCPTASIGTVSKHDLSDATSAFPERIDDEVYRCGYSSESSFGAFAYFIRDSAGNVLVDSPRFASPLVRKIEELGGVRRMLLTHRDDVADHAKFAARFGCERVLHRADAGGARAVEIQPAGDGVVELSPDLLMIPTPGHTEGHAVFLYREKFLFTGDHLAWSERRGHLYAFRSACWYSWPEQIRSMERLREFAFEWVLPGHGRPTRLAPGTSRAELERCVAWMKAR